MFVGGSLFGVGLTLPVVSGAGGTGVGEVGSGGRGLGGTVCVMGSCSGGEGILLCSPSGVVPLVVQVPQLVQLQLVEGKVGCWSCRQDPLVRCCPLEAFVGWCFVAYVTPVIVGVRG